MAGAARRSRRSCARSSLATWGGGTSDRPTVALVGARASTAYGEGVAADLAADLSASGAVIVSGAAYGIDGAAHRAALSTGGMTVAFLAGGVDRAYPRGHESLLARIASTGAVWARRPAARHPPSGGSSHLSAPVIAKSGRSSSDRRREDMDTPLRQQPATPASARRSNATSRRPAQAERSTCDGRGYRIVDKFEDDGVSALGHKVRQGFRDMLAAANAVSSRSSWPRKRSAWRATSARSWSCTRPAP